MLARAARRKLRRDAFQHSTSTLEQLTLPWLCPAQLRWTASSRTVTTGQSYDSRKQNPLQPTRSSRPETRSLSTSAEVLPPSYTSLPMDGMLQAWPYATGAPMQGKMPSWDPRQTLIIHKTLASALPTTNFKDGIGGDPVELHQNLHACLRIGRLDRAAAIVQRLTDMYQTSAPEVVHAHNVYLQGVLELAQEEGSETTMADIESWYKKEMAAKAIEPDAQTCVILLRASMILLQGGVRDASIRKYLELVQSLAPEVFEEVNTSPDFTDEEFDMLIRSQPELFEEPSSPESQPEVVQERLVSTPAGHAIAIEHGLIEDPSLRVKPVSQKGAGLKTLQAALAPFEPGKGVSFPTEMEGTEEAKARAYAYARQLNLEQRGLEAAVERWKEENSKLKDIGIHINLHKSVVRAWMWRWYSALLPLVKEELAQVREVLSDASKAKKSDDRLIYGPYMELATPKQLTAITVQCTLQYIAGSQEVVGDDPVALLRTSKLAHTIGQSIQQEINLSISQKKRAELRKQRVAERRQMLNKLSKTPMTFDAPEKSDFESVVDQLERRKFPLHIKARLGSILLEKLVQTAMIDVTRKDPRTQEPVTSTQAAFSISSGFFAGRKVWTISAHHELMNKLNTDGWLAINTLRLPMLAEPKPWSGYEDGGYFTRGESVVRAKGSDEAQRVYAISAVEKGDMDTMLAGLDVLGKVPWKINKGVFKVVVEAWNKGEGLAGLIPDKLEIQRPVEPAPDAPFTERMKWVKKMREVENLKLGFHSQKCFQNFQLEIARAYYNEEKFYFPHNIDFRGRAYPIPPILNHMGADMARGLLTFAEGKELGATGLKWLKVHLANVYGYDKASLSDRENFTMEHINEVYDSATNPLTGNRWWAKAEDPWQCLACCMELKGALDSPHPEQYICHLPVHQDGTCNGLQHYAALGGDEAGATQVNLEPGDRPQDIYTAVAELVREYVDADAKQGVPVAQFLQGKITRKVVKRTVMTNVYGVTYQGAKLQVHDELKALYPDFEETDHVRSLMQPAHYVAHKIFEALGRIFNGAREIQEWLGQCCSRITTSVTPEQVENMRRHFNGDPQPYDKKYKFKTVKRANVLAALSEKNWEFKSSVIWTTPLKMPVVQPYRDAKSENIKTNLQVVSIIKPKFTDAVSKRKQMQAFPPNFIHSLDASHMMLSALKCNEAGITFAAVHDSFWTHPGDVPRMNVILRNAFIQMHSEDIIGRLAAEFDARYGENMYRATLEPNSEVGQQILEWRREELGIKSKRSRLEASFKELAMEADRQRLLQSEDEADRNKGQEMVTPTSIYLSQQNEAELLDGNKMAGRPEFLQKGLATADDADAEAQDPVQDEVMEDVDEESGDRDAEPDDDGESDLESELEAELEKPVAPKAEAKKKVPASLKLHLWLPLTFPPVPKKGSWDIRRLKESKYFFS